MISDNVHTTGDRFVHFCEPMRYGRYLTVLFLMISSGCWNASVPEKPAEISPFVSRGMIVATFHRFIPEGGTPFERFEFFAMFPRYMEAHQRQASFLLPGRVPETDIPIDACTRPEPILQERTQRPGTSENIVTLVDAGDMFLHYDNNSVIVPTLTFPDLLKVIDGVTYAATPENRVVFAPGKAYTIQTRGTDSIGPFETVLNAPSDLGDIEVNGVSPLDNLPLIEKGKPIRIQWEGGGYGDEIILETTWTTPGLSWGFLCRLKDDGEFTISDTTTDLLEDAVGGASHEMMLSRVRQISFAAKGLSFGTFSFVVRNGFLLELRDPN